MKNLVKYLAAVLLCFIAIASFAQQKKTALAIAKAKAANTGQVKEYWFVLLKTGSNRTHDSATAANIQAGHMANISKLYNAGKLKVAGPFGEDGDWRGIFIFDCPKEEVESLLKTDPAIAAGRLAYEIHSWWTAPIGSFVPGIPEKK